MQISINNGVSVILASEDTFEVDLTLYPNLLGRGKPTGVSAVSWSGGESITSITISGYIMSVSLSAPVNAGRTLSFNTLF